MNLTLTELTHRVALLLAWDVLLNVLVSPVKHQLLLLLVIHPHDLFGYFLNDLLEFLELLGPSKGHFLAKDKGVSLNIFRIIIIIYLSK